MNSTTIGYAITMCIISAIMNYLHNKDCSVDKSGIKENYVIKTPALLSQVFCGWVIVGILLFGLFAWVKYFKNPDLDNGNFIFAIVFASIGVVVQILASKWRITVEGNDVTLHRLFRKPVKYQIDQFTGELGSKFELRVFVEEKKVITIDSLCDNYYQFYEYLSSHGKISNDVKKKN